MNQLPTTDALIRNIKALIAITDIGIGQCAEELKKHESQPDSFMTKFLINTMDDARMAKVALEDYIYRATHDSYGELIK